MVSGNKRGKGGRCLGLVLFSFLSLRNSCCDNFFFPLIFGWSWFVVGENRNLTLHTKKKKSMGEKVVVKRSTPRPVW